MFGSCCLFLFFVIISKYSRKFIALIFYLIETKKKCLVKYMEKIEYVSGRIKYQFQNNRNIFVYPVIFYYHL